jgi:hypothetical protein
MSLADLITAVSSADNNIRNEAEAKLREARDNNPALFILACSEEFAGNNLQDTLKTQAAALIKYTLINFAVHFLTSYVIG